MNKIALFKGKTIRRTIYQDEWWFSVVDVIAVLTDSAKPRVYWNAMKTRVKSEDGIELSTIFRQLKLESSDGKKYETDCANPEGIFRIIQSIPSPRAEPPYFYRVYPIFCHSHESGNLESVIILNYG